MLPGLLVPPGRLVVPALLVLPVLLMRRVLSGLVMLPEPTVWLALSVLLVLRVWLALSAPQALLLVMLAPQQRAQALLDLVGALLVSVELRRPQLVEVSGERHWLSRSP